MHLPPKLHLRARRPDPGNVSSAAIVRAIAAAPERQQAFLGLTGSGCSPHREGTDPDRPCGQAVRPAIHPRPSARRRQPPGDRAPGPAKARCVAFRARSLSCCAGGALRAAPAALARRRQHAAAPWRAAFAPLGVFAAGPLPEPALMARVLDHRTRRRPDRRADQGDLRGPASEAVAAELLRCWGLPGGPGAGAPAPCSNQAVPARLSGRGRQPGSLAQGARQNSNRRGVRRRRPPRTSRNARGASLDLRAYDLAAIAKLVDTHCAGFAEVPRLAELSAQSGGAAVRVPQPEPTPAPRWDPAPAARWRDSTPSSSSRACSQGRSREHIDGPRERHRYQRQPGELGTRRNRCGSVPPRSRGRTAGGRAASHAASPRPSNSRMQASPARRCGRQHRQEDPAMPSASATPPPIQ